MSKKGLFLGLLIVGGAVTAALLAPRVMSQGRPEGERDGARRRQAWQMPLGGGSWIGASVRDLEDEDVTREKIAGPKGALVERLDPDGPAGRAGLKAGDIVVEFDGEAVRSAMHLTRLVRETPEGRPVNIAFVRGGARTVMAVTPTGPRALGPELWREPLRRMEELGRNFDFDFDVDVDSMIGWGGRGGRLGVVVQPLTPQLATYFGVADGLLVTSVTEDSAAARAGLKAGDVMTTVNGKPVTTRSELVRVLRGVEDDAEASIEISRDRKTITAKVKLEPARERRGSARAREM